MRPPPPLPYASPQLATGPSGFRLYGYPSDDAGFWNGSCKDDGRSLSFGPSSVARRMLPIVLILLLYAVVVASTHWAKLRTASGSGWIKPAALLLVPTIFVIGIAWVMSRLSREPWITVDRTEALIHLPRQRLAIPFASVLRLQLVSLGPFGRLRGKSQSGELQIVFRELGGEETRCIVSQPALDGMRRFAIAFQTSTGIPVSSVHRTVAGEWRVEPLNNDTSKPTG